MRARVANSVAMVKKPNIAATSDETLDDLLTYSRQGRTSTPIRRSFLQDTQGRGQPAPLEALVTQRRALALDLLLLLHCGAGRTPWDVALPAMAWARALDMPETAGSETTVSKNWTWLEENDLLRSERYQRMRKVYLLKEDGSGDEYVRSSGEARGFFRLPFAYFTERWHKKLKLPGKAVLLIALSQKPTFNLVTERAAEWYGVSADTLQRGLDDLQQLELLRVWTKARKAPRARLGFTIDHHYQLKKPFRRRRA